MEWIDSLRGSTVGLEAGPLIYYIESEGRPELAEEYRNILLQ